MAKYGTNSILIALLAFGAVAIPAAAGAQISISVNFAPPPLPVYEQPDIPGPGYLWTPGYWAYGEEGYFWVPGTWVEPPSFGLLWTPGYWGWSAGEFQWNTGYWGPQVGFYGGVNYGFGYGGHGYEGGYWRDNEFYYNREVTRINNVNITNVYNKTVVNNVTVQRVSYAGGPGGVAARPTPQEEQAAHMTHVPPTPVQVQHHQSAATNHEQLASVNQGKPRIAATAKPADFTSHVVAANRAGGPMPPAPPAHGATQAAPHAAPHAEPQAAPQAAPHAAQVPIHARDLPQAAPMAPASAASASEAERNRAREAAAMQARHDQEREALARQQEADHARVIAQERNNQAMANMERQHQQQTQELQQRHTIEQQQRMAPPPQAPRAAAPHAPPPPPPQEHPPQERPPGSQH